MKPFRHYKLPKNIKMTPKHSSLVLSWKYQSSLALKLEDKAILIKTIFAKKKHELRNGEAISIDGGSGNHSLIIVSISSELYARLKSTGRRVHSTEMRIAVPDGESTSFTYADVVVPDGQEIYTTPKDTLTNPMLIVEVLSPSTEGYDRGEKFDNYC